MKILQLTDIHLLPPGGTLHGLDPAEQLRGAVADILARQADADLLVLTGDLANDGDPEAYALLREILAPLPMPVRFLLGNHDARPAFRAEFPEAECDATGFVQSFLDTDHGRLLFLDSHSAGEIGGRYCADRLAWLDSALAEAGPLPVTVFVHHPPMPDGLAHFRHIGFHDGEAVLARLRAHAPGLRHVVFGHIHVPLAGTTPSGIAFSSGQACSHRFIADLEDPAPWWTGGAPTYRVLLIDEAGFRAYTLEAGAQRLSRAPVCPGP
ncbi:phosphodiesterase [Oceanicella sp. SM1341]|uniref:phosphodiesterase n=1 Tax=Oceanicella sp. SM1341 TaxID=1548889 RepID=UPI000E4E0C80|nr:phosphodiesterase [Oceanicella sp. SM1341]